MSRLAELLGHVEEGRVLRSQAAPSPRVTHLVYKRKSPEKLRKKKKKVGAVKEVVPANLKKKKAGGVKLAPAVVVEDVVPANLKKKKNSGGVKLAPAVVAEEVVPEKLKKKKAGGVKRAPAVVVEEVKKRKRAPPVVVEEVVVKRQRKSATKGLVSATTTTTVSSWSVSLSSADAVAAATEHLLAADVRFQSVVAKHGAPDFEREGSAFTALVRSIVYQQLAGKAAATIHGRLIDLCGGPENVTPAVVAALTAEQFKGAGISSRKVEFLRDLAEKFVSGALSDEKLAVMSEDDLLTALTAVKGIGVWSAQMFMIFHLHKPDVLPVGDLGIRRGFQKLYEMKKEPSAAEMENLSISWRPYRTLAARYLWNVKDNIS